MKTVMIADNDQWIVDSLATAIKAAPEGVVVLKATNGSDAVTLIRSISIDVVLIGLEMPQLEGYQLIEFVRRERPLLPVLALTGNCTPDVRKRLGSLGVQQCFSKPFDVNDMISAVRGCGGNKGASQG
jgi:two-component system alkaline phosphatase synthesis response regulator PhoP